MRPFDDLGTTRWIDKERWSAVWPFSSIAQHDCDLRVTLWNGVKRFRRLERRESLPLDPPTGPSHWRSLAQHDQHPWGRDGSCWFHPTVRAAAPGGIANHSVWITTTTKKLLPRRVAGLPNAVSTVVFNFSNRGVVSTT